MSNELTIKNQFTPEQLTLITNTVARGATRDELDLFLYRCKEMGLNPLKPGQIFFIKYGSTATMVVGIEGFRSKAARTGNHISTARGVIRTEKGELIAGTCTVKRYDHQGKEQSYYEECPFHEFNNPKNPKWQSMPETMIKKCAEAAALRMAYPDDLGGVYVDSEQDVIEKSSGTIQDTVRIAPDQPTADDQSAEGLNIMHEKYGYLIPFGSLRGHRIESIAIDKLERAVELTSMNIASGKVYSGSSIEEMQTFVDKANAYIKYLENSKP